jgi:hypothetical protein
MPVNMDPQKRRKKRASQEAQPANRPDAQTNSKTDKLEDMTDRDREQALADAEWKNLWDATEVIDMDKW